MWQAGVDWEADIPAAALTQGAQILSDRMLVHNFPFPSLADYWRVGPNFLHLYHDRIGLIRAGLTPMH